jgi:protein SCO1
MGTMTLEPNTRGPSYRLILAMMAALAVIAVIAFAAWRFMAPEPVARSGGAASLAIPGGVKIGGAFRLTNQSGHTVTDEDFRGKFMLISFGYGFCPDICPTALQTMGVAIDLLGPDGERIQPIFITIDPERDTVDFMADYVASFHPRLVGLTGSKADTDKTAALFRVYHAKAEGGAPDAYLMDHSAFIYLMDPDGAFLNIFQHATTPDELARDIRAHLK